jgi:shikimate kinase
MRDRERNIILTGFRATGKTAVGRQLADRLGYAFVDLDALLEAETGMSIPQLFTERGEAAFRELESQMVERVAQQRRCVIATGGGTVVSPSNLRALKQSGVVVTLTADLETLLSRLGMATDQPILRGDDLRARVEQLLAERREAYAQADVTVDTTARTVDETVDCVLHAVKAGPFRAPKEPRRA